MAEIKEVPYSHQQTDWTCGPSSLRMVFNFFGLRVSEKNLARIAKTTKKYGTSHKNLINAARKEGFYCFVHENASLHAIKHFIDKGLPVIIDCLEYDSKEGHYSVVVGYTKNHVLMNDPWNGRNFRIQNDDFRKLWHDKYRKYNSRRWILVLARKKFHIGRQYLPL